MFKDRGRLAITGALGLLLLVGFAFGRLTGPSETAKAFNDPAVALTPTPAASADAQAFYLSDFKTGYSDGYANGLNGLTAASTSTSRVGYNDGFKQGFSSGYQARLNESTSSVPVVTSRVPTRERVVYRSVERERPVLSRKKRNSTLKTVLTIAAPAALGAGVGGAFGGKKGAGVGALLGGGGGALFHLIKNR